MQKLNKYFSTIFLGSQSTARKEILLNQNLKVIVRPVDIEEISNLEKPEKIIVDLAKQKMNRYLQLYNKEKYPILCCDTLVYFNNELLGKAKTKEEAKKRLLSFSLKKQEVYSGYALYIPGKQIFYGFDKATIFFKKLDEKTIDDYLETKEWIEAAGSYRIQGEGKHLISKILGDYNTIVGLPLSKISVLIKSTLS